MGRNPKAFSFVQVRLVEAGERSGTLETILRHLASYLQRENALVQKVKKALMYPAIVTGVGLIVVTILVVFVLPNLTGMLQSFNTDLPLITRIVIGFSDTAESLKVYLFAFLLILAAIAAWAVQKPGVRKKIDLLLMRAPGLGRLVIQRNMARFGRTMALLLNAGLPLPECLAMARDGVSNLHMQGALNQVRAEVVGGRSLAKALGTVPFIPGLFVQMVNAGEQAGTLEGNLTSMADFYDHEVEEQLTTMTGLIEPALTVVMGCGVAFIALAVMMPMFSLMDSLGQQ
jgi:type II secretory pathway component PulF